MIDWLLKSVITKPVATIENLKILLSHLASLFNFLLLKEPVIGNQQY